jgi:hypothetical protein
MKRLPLLLFLFFSLHCFAQELPAADTVRTETFPVPRDSTERHFSLAPRQNAFYTSPNRFWTDLSIGTGFIQQRFGLGLAANLHYLDGKRRHYELRYVYTEDFAVLSPAHYGVSDAGYLLGWLHARKHSLMEVAVGISCVWGYTPGELVEGMWWNTYRPDYFVTIGLPVEIDVKLMAGHYAGLGMSVKANLNPEASYALVGLELTIWGPGRK